MAFYTCLVFAEMSATIPDIPQWLLNKLGSSERTWVDGNIAPHLNKDVLKGIYDCFLELQPSLKIKLLLSILHIVRRNLETVSLCATSL